MTYAEALAFEVTAIAGTVNRSLDAIAGIVAGRHQSGGIHNMPRDAFDAIPGDSLHLVRDNGNGSDFWTKSIGSVVFYTDEPADMPATLEHLSPTHPLIYGDPENHVDSEVVEERAQAAADHAETLSSLPRTTFSSVA